jgi:hypothetical protein
MGYRMRTTRTTVGDIKKTLAKERESAALRHDRNAMHSRPTFTVKGCACSCHTNPNVAVCICCEKAAEKFIRPEDKGDKSQQILDSFLKGKR